MFEDFDTRLEDDRLEAERFERELEDAAYYAALDGRAIPTAADVRASLFELAGEAGIAYDEESAGGIERELEQTLTVLSCARGRLSDLKARAVLHAPPQARKRVASLASSSAYTLTAADFPDFLEALATGKVRELRATANHRLDRLCERLTATRNTGLEPELGRLAAIVAVCELALEALAERNPEHLRALERALRLLSQGHSHTGTRAYSRPRRRGPCSKPSRHLTQAVRRSHAPPHYSGRQPRERGGLTPLA